MSVLIITRNPIYVEAITSWLTKFDENVKVIDSNIRVDMFMPLSKNAPRLVIIDGVTDQQDSINCINRYIDDSRHFNFSLVLLLSDLAPDQFASRLMLPVSALVHFQDAKEFFTSEISNIHKRSIYYSNFFKAKYGFVPKKDDPITFLTKTELTVAFMVLQGFSSKEIAAKLSRSTLTIEDHRKHIKDKIDINGGKKSLQYHLSQYTCWLSHLISEKYHSHNHK